MKYIYLVRHAKSSWADWSLPDHDRPLNKRGKHDAPQMAKRMRSHIPRLDGLVSSTAKRARKTAKAYRKAFELDQDVLLFRPDLYHADPDTIEQQIRDLPKGWQHVAVFGHNPGFTYMVNRCPGVSLDNLPTSGIFGCRANIETWEDWSMSNAESIFLFYPKMFS